MSDSQRPWEPDPTKLGNWQGMFDQRRNGAAAPPPAAVTETPFDDADIPSLDLNDYRPWILQRGGGRPGLMLALRRYDGRAQLWQCWASAYHSLLAVDYLGTKMVSLEFGARKFLLEGDGLDLLARYLQQGAVLKIIEYAPAIWPTRSEGPVVTAIRRIEVARVGDS